MVLGVSTLNDLIPLNCEILCDAVLALLDFVLEDLHEIEYIDRRRPGA